LELLSQQNKVHEIRNQIYEDDPELIRLLKQTSRENLTDERFQTIREAVDAAQQAGTLNDTNSTGDTALTIACGNDLPTAVEYLLSRGANPHVV
jgi:ankyrin repeat protein